MMKCQTKFAVTITKLAVTITKRAVTITKLAVTIEKGKQDRPKNNFKHNTSLFLHDLYFLRHILIAKSLI